MKKVFKVLLLLLALTTTSQTMQAQSFVVIMNQNYTCENPQGGEWTLKKGQAINVYEEDNAYVYSGPFLASGVEIPVSKCHLPGAVKGEKYLIINVDNLSLREKPSTKSGIYCYDEDYGGTFDPSKFSVNYKKELGVYGTSYSWKPFYFPKGTRIPYLGKSGNFYKTTFDNKVFYVDAKKCTLK